MLQRNLHIMRQTFTDSPAENVYLPWPTWLRKDYPLFQIYNEKFVLLKHGQVCYGHIVQANTILFKLFPHSDHPASIIYSHSPYVTEHLEVLQTVAAQLLGYKNKPLDSIPEELREAARIITDEYDQSSVRFTMHFGGESVEFTLLPIMVFRRLLPKRKLCGSFLPIITAPGCNSSLILPARYWSPEFKRLWIQGLL